MIANKGLRLRTEVLQFATKNGYTCVRRLRRSAVKLLPAVAVRRIPYAPAALLRSFLQVWFGGQAVFRAGPIGRPYAPPVRYRMVCTYPMKKELGPIRVRTISLAQRVRRSMPVG